MNRLITLLFSYFLFLGTAIAEPLTTTLPGLGAVEQQLVIEQERNVVARDRLQELQREQQRRLQALVSETVEETDLKRAALESEMVRADLSATTLTLADVRQSIANLERTIQELKRQLQDASFASVGMGSISPSDVLQWQKRLDYQQQLLKIQQARSRVLQSAQLITKYRLELQEEWQTQLETTYKNYAFEKRERALEQLEISMRKEQQIWMERLTTLNQKAKVLEAKGETNTPSYAHLSLLIFEAEERGNISNLQLSLTRLQHEVADLGVINSQAYTITDWNAANQQATAILNRLENTLDLLTGKVALIQQRQTIESQGKVSGLSSTRWEQSNLQLLNDLTRSYQKQSKIVLALIKQTKEYQADIAKNLRHALARRQMLPGFNLGEWITLGKKLWTMPVAIWDVLGTIKKQLIAAFSQLSVLQKVLFGLVQIMWLGICILLHRYLKRQQQNFQGNLTWMATHILSVLLQLVLRNLTSIFLFVALLITFITAGLPMRAYKLLGSVAIIWFGFKSALDLARLTLLESLGTEDAQTGHDVKLYRMLRWLLITGGVLSLLMILSYQLSVVYEVRDFLNRLFMLFLLIISIALFHGRKMILGLLYPYLTRERPYLNRHYFKRALYLLTILIPLMLFSNAVVGLIGYVELAWSLSRYQAYFLLVFTGYLLARGLLRDASEWLSSLLIRKLRNGWLWSEAILKPFDRILHIGLFFFAGFVMFSLSGWGESSFVANKLKEILQMRLLAIAGSEITLLVLLKAAVAIMIVIWAARWSREFAYRWMFVRVKDLGLRNSLAVFTQYTAVTLGFFICLKIMGISVVALAAILTGLAIGIGFGLRDLANNFVSGILLLIERPVRKGDLVTIGGYEGEVTHMGMRSFTIYTSDRTEVLVPHSEAFSKSFVNWTHQDSVVRGVVMIKISRRDDPHQVKESLLQIVSSTPGVLPHPAPEVFLKNLDDTLVEFQVNYFINLQVTPMRVDMRSKVLFAIWDRFKEMGIHPPHPQQDIYIKALPHAEQV